MLRAAGQFPAVLEQLSDDAAASDDDLKLVRGTHWAVTMDEDGQVSGPSKCISRLTLLLLLHKHEHATCLVALILR